MFSRLAVLASACVCLAAGQTVLQSLAANPELSTFTSLLTATGLAEGISGDGPYFAFGAAANPMRNRYILQSFVCVRFGPKLVGFSSQISTAPHSLRGLAFHAVHMFDVYILCAPGLEAALCGPGVCACYSCDANRPVWSSFRVIAQLLHYSCIKNRFYNVLY